MGQKKIVIVGGGYVGVQVAQALEGHADVTLIEQREAFVHPPAAIRAVVQPDLLDQIIMPYDKVLTSGQVVQGKAVSVYASEVTLEGGARYPADYVVIATGSSYSAPFKPAGDSIADFRAAHAEVSGTLDAAKSVVIVGAGPVGVELAGEIATARPEKSVTLISADETLFPMYPAKLGAELERKLEAMGVSVILGQRAQDLQHTDRPYAGSITLADGRVIEADLVFPVIGAKPQSGLVQSLPGAEIGAGGRIKADKWLRPSDYPNVFLAGDVADVGDAMTIVAVSRQSPWLIKTLKKVLAGAPVESLKPYAPWKTAPILVPLGPKGGNSWLFATVGDWLTRKMKGQDLFIPKYRKTFGLPDAPR